jgi:hypothetical protein
LLLIGRRGCYMSPQATNSIPSNSAYRPVAKSSTTICL